jgi:uncharacterized protein YjbI with pentapeptide repeats
MSQASTAARDGFEPSPYLNTLIAAINDGAKAAQGGALLFLLVGLYLLASAFAVSDEDLLLGRTVTISQIGAALPVSFSFAIAPMVFVFLHSYTLVRYDMLAANIRQFRREVLETVNIETDRERCRQLLANVEFVETLTTPRSSPQYTWLWFVLFFGIMVVFPVAVLLLVQINALRYQSDLITNVQRAWLVLDLAVLVWFFVRRPFDTAGEKHAPLWRRTLRWGLLIGLPTLVIGLSVFWLCPAPATADPDLIHSARRPLSGRLVWQPLDVACFRLNWGCRFLRVDHRTLVDKVWDDKAMTNLRGGTAEVASALAGIEGVFLRGRSLRFAVLDGSRLYAADLIGVDLTGASLVSVGLMGAKMNSANLTGAKLTDAILTDAILTGANVSRADLRDAKLNGANLNGAKLNGAKLNGANLTGAILEAQGLSANLQDADLYEANLTGAKLLAVNLQNANLSFANLQDANLGDAWLSRTDLPPSVIGETLTVANLSGARLSYANLSGANLQKANLTGANLEGAKYSSKTIFPPNFDPKAAGMVLIADPPAKAG